MEFIGTNYILDEIQYTKEEVEIAREIKAAMDEKLRSFLVECFEDVYGKPFPASEPVMEENEFESNVSTMFLGGGCISHHMNIVLTNARLARKSILPL